jgi:putative transposase
MSHKLTGSTKPDQYGRAVDGKFKSRKNAFIQFEWIAQELKTFLYDEMANTPDEDNITPNARAEELVKFGEFTGNATSLDATMIVITSVPSGTTPRITGGYVRTARGKYTSLEFQAATQGMKRVDELRSDCVDPSVMYARIKNCWFQIFSRAVLIYQQLTELQKLWRLLNKPIDAAAARESKSEIDRARYDRHAAANAAAVAHQHLAPAVPSPSPEAPVTQPRTQELALDWEKLDEFE